MYINSFAFVSILSKKLRKSRKKKMDVAICGEAVSCTYRYYENYIENVSGVLNVLHKSCLRRKRWPFRSKIIRSTFTHTPRPARCPFISFGSILFLLVFLSILFKTKKRTIDARKSVELFLKEIKNNKNHFGHFPIVCRVSLASLSSLADM